MLLRRIKMNSEIDDEIQNEIRTRLILAKNSEDDSIVHAYMLKAIKDVYMKYNMKIPDKVEDYIKKHAENIQHEISIKLESKKQELHEILKKGLNEAISRKDNLEFQEIKPRQLKETTKSKTSLFPEGYFKKK
jgi:hypothetical protein